MVENNQKKYNEAFEVEQARSEKLQEAFKQVSDIRKFEIELYWKRSGYFWALIAAAYAGYFAVIGSERVPNKYFLTFILGLIGFVFTFAWHLANRGSKYWQENWENHLDLLEDGITGPLYKTLLERPGREEFLSDKLVTGPMAISVSKINQWVSVFVLFTWLPLISYCFYRMWLMLPSSPQKWLVLACYIVVLVVTGFICVMMRYKAKTHKGTHRPHMITRETEIGGSSKH